jgi:hypothetical protein
MPPEPVDSRVQLIEALWGDPEARKELEEIIVKKFPASAVALPGGGGGTNGLMEVPGRNGAGGEDYKGIVEDRDAWARKKAHEVLNDLARQRGTMPTAWQA